MYYLQIYLNITSSSNTTSFAFDKELRASAVRWLYIWINLYYSDGSTEKLSNILPSLLLAREIALTGFKAEQWQFSIPLKRLIIHVIFSREKLPKTTNQNIENYYGFCLFVSCWVGLRASTFLSWGVQWLVCSYIIFSRPVKPWRGILVCLA